MEETYCICKKPAGRSFMIECDVCRNWFHGKCIKIREQVAHTIDKFACPECQENGHFTTYKQRHVLIEEQYVFDQPVSTRGRKRKASEVQSSATGTNASEAVIEKHTPKTAEVPNSGTASKGDKPLSERSRRRLFSNDSAPSPVVSTTPQGQSPLASAFGVPCIDPLLLQIEKLPRNEAFKPAPPTPSRRKRRVLEDLNGTNEASHDSNVDSPRLEKPKPAGNLVLLVDKHSALDPIPEKVTHRRRRRIVVPPLDDDYSNLPKNIRKVIAIAETYEQFYESAATANPNRKTDADGSQLSGQVSPHLSISQSSSSQTSSQPSGSTPQSATAAERGTFSGSFSMPKVTRKAVENIVRVAGQYENVLDLDKRRDWTNCVARIAVRMALHHQRTRNSWRRRTKRRVVSEEEVQEVEEEIERKLPDVSCGPVGIEFRANTAVLIVAEPASQSGGEEECVPKKTIVGTIRFRMMDLGGDIYAALRWLLVREWISLEAKITDVSGPLLGIDVKVFLHNNAFESSSPAEDTARYPALKNIMGKLGRSSEAISDDVNNLDSSTSTSLDLSSLYEAIKPVATLEVPQPSGLVPQLRPYQRRGLAWMLHREGALPSDLVNPYYTSEGTGNHPLWEEIKLADDSSVYYNRFTGRLSLKQFRTQRTVPGGILADEMGLGKTVEAIALFLSHTRDPDDCGPREVDSSADEKEGTTSSSQVVVDGDGRRSAAVGWLKCKSTLVVSPDSIREQWRFELKRHAPDLKVYVYEGIRSQVLHGEEQGAATAETEGKKKRKRARRSDRGGDSSSKKDAAECSLWNDGDSSRASSQSMPFDVMDGDGDGQPQISAEELAQYDVVLTTYTVLRTEVNYSQRADVIDALRYVKKYDVPDSPLLSLSWWRVVLDEAQMVEGTTSQAAAMALRLVTENRWCVTGTPIGGHGLEDLYGLLLFLGHDPYKDRFWFVNCLKKPFERAMPAGQQRLVNLLRDIMWRYSKVHVTDEVGLPTCHKDPIALLTFSDAEREFYQRLMRDAVSSVQAHEMMARQSQGQPSGRINPPPVHEQEETGNGEAQGPSMVLIDEDDLYSHRDRRRLQGPATQPETASTVLLSLRQACCHPQLTKQWQESLRTDLQVQTGGMLGMDEIMQRMLDECGHELQACERELCRTLNALAACVLARSGSSVEDRAIGLYEKAHSIENSGIAKTTEGLEEDLDIVTAPAALRSWQLVELNTTHNLSQLYEARGRTELAEKMRIEHQGKRDELLASLVGNHRTAENKVLDLDKSMKSYITAKDPVYEQWQKRFDELHEAEKKRWVENPDPNVGISGAVEEEYRAERTRLTKERDDFRAVIDQIDLKRKLPLLFAYVDQRRTATKKTLQGHERVMLQLKDIFEHRVRVDEVIWRDYGCLTRCDLARMTTVESQLSLDRLKVFLKQRSPFVCISSKSKKTTLLPSLVHSKVSRYDNLMQDLHRTLNDRAIDRLLKTIVSDSKTPPQACVRKLIEESRNEWDQSFQTLLDSLRLPVEAEKVLRSLIGSEQAQKDKRYDEAIKALLDHVVKSIPKAVAIGDGEEISDKESESEADDADENNNSSGENVSDKSETSDTESASAVTISKETKESNSSSKKRKRTASTSAAKKPAGRKAGTKPKGSAGKKRASAVGATVGSVQGDVDRRLAKEIKNQRKAEIRLAERVLRAMEDNEAVRDAVRSGDPYAVERAYNRIQKYIRFLRILRDRERALCTKESAETELNAATRQLDMASQRMSFEGFQENQTEKDLTTSAILEEQEGTLAGEVKRLEMEAVTRRRKQRFLEQKCREQKEVLHGSKHAPDDAICPVCQERLLEAVLTKCGHLYCLGCVDLLLRKGDGRCAMCRGKVTKESVSRVSLTPAVRPASSDPIDRIKIRGSFGSKVDALIRHLLYLAEHDPTAKSLVFSQWKGLLKIVSSALGVNGLQYVSLEGSVRKRSRAVWSFSNDPQVKVFLLSMHAGASGLTLVAATHVFIMEPSLNPAVEEQAINRVHRIGQTKETFITHLIVEDTVEEKVLRLQKRKRMLTKEQGLLRRVSNDQVDADDIAQLFHDEITARNDLLEDAAAAASQQTQQPQESNVYSSVNSLLRQAHLDRQNTQAGSTVQ